MTVWFTIITYSRGIKMSFLFQRTYTLNNMARKKPHLFYFLLFQMWIFISEISFFNILFINWNGCMQRNKWIYKGSWHIIRWIQAISINWIQVYNLNHHEVRFGSVIKFTLRWIPLAVSNLCWTGSKLGKEKVNEMKIKKEESQRNVSLFI